MKKILCALLCMMLVMISAESLAAVDYTLQEKMQKQLDSGSGLKGTLQLHGEGNDPFILSLQPFQDVELQFRGMRTGEQGHYYFYQAGDDESQKGLTEIFDDGSSLFFRSDFLPGEVIRFPALAALADAMLPSRGGNPSIASAAVRWIQTGKAQQEALLNPVLEILEKQLEVWLARYAEASEVKTTESGTSAVELSYSIPMDDFRQEIVSLMNILQNSAEGKALMDQIFSEEQKGLFENQNLGYYFLDALSALNNEYDINYTSTISTLGVQLSSSLELPLDESSMGFKSLLIEDKNGLISYTLRNDEQVITLLMGRDYDWSQIDSASAWVIMRPNPNGEETEKGLYHAIRLELQHSSEKTTDEESRDHERTVWKLTAERDVSRLPEGEDEKNYPEEPPLSAELNLHYFSRYSQSSPTTLEYSLSIIREDFLISGNGQMKTSSPWVFSPFSTEGAREFTTFSANELTVKIAEFLAGASEQLTPAKPETAEENTEGTNQDQNPEENQNEAETGETESTAAVMETSEDASSAEKQESPETTSADPEGSSSETADAADGNS